MKRKIAKFIWIPAAVVVALVVIAVLVLSLVRVNPMLDNFGGIADYERIELIINTNGNEFHGQEGTNGHPGTKELIEEGLKDSDFSIMHAMLEGKYSYGLKLKTEKVTENGEEVTKEVTKSSKEILNYGVGENMFMLKFYLKEGEVRKLCVGGKEIVYDRILLIVTESEGTVAEMQCIPYLEYNVSNSSQSDKYDEEGRIGSDYYSTNVITVKMMTSKLYRNLENLVSWYE